jgi:hypothetical protein
VDRVSDKLIPVASACDIVGVGRRHFYDWVKRGLIDVDGSLLSERDVVELTVLRELTACLGASEGRQAFRHVREEARATVPPGAFEVLWDVRGHEATLIRLDSELTKAIRDLRCGDRFQLVRPKREVDRTLGRIAADREDKSSEPPRPAPGRRSRRASHESA